MQKIGFFALRGGVPTMEKAGLVPVLHAECGSIDSLVSHLRKEFFSNTNLARVCLIFQHIGYPQFPPDQFIDIIYGVIKSSWAYFLTSLIK